MTRNTEDSIASKDENSVAYAIRWNSIDWKKAKAVVSRLQYRISKAAMEGKHALVARLQHLLTNSFSAKALAVKQVTSTKGKRTPGVDNVIWVGAASKMRAVDALTGKGYRAQPLKRIHIPKSNGKMRPLSIPTMHDRAVQALYNMALDPVQEASADPNSYGFRKGRGAKDACFQLRCDLNQKTSSQWVLEGDIKGCFDTISHEWLLDNVCMDKNVLRQFLKAGYYYEKKLFDTERGTPQGGVISPTLANITLNGMERLIKEHYPRTKGINFVRYADDFVVTCPDKDTAGRIKHMLTDFLAERGLILSEEKTLITHISEGFDFLSWTFRKFKGVLIVKPSKKSFERVKNAIRDVVLTHGKAQSQSVIIKKLNPVLRGWANYHRNVNSKRTFSALGNYVFNTLWRWASRKHSNKHLMKVLRKYWKPVGTRKWTFTDGKLVLFRIESTKIVRHWKCRSDRNPYIHLAYFQERYDQRSHPKRV